MAAICHLKLVETGLDLLVQPRPAEVEPELEEETVPVLDLHEAGGASPAPTAFGIRLVEPSTAAKKRKKTALWPTATETNVQLSLFD
jgi:hypothetical protein